MRTFSRTNILKSDKTQPFLFHFYAEPPNKQDEWLLSLTERFISKGWGRRVGLPADALPHHAPMCAAQHNPSPRNTKKTDDSKVIRFWRCVGDSKCVALASIPYPRSRRRAIKPIMLATPPFVSTPRCTGIVLGQRPVGDGAGVRACTQMHCPITRLCAQHDTIPNRATQKKRTTRKSSVSGGA